MHFVQFLTEMMCPKNTLWPEVYGHQSIEHPIPKPKAVILSYFHSVHSSEKVFHYILGDLCPSDLNSTERVRVQQEGLRDCSRSFQRCLLGLMSWFCEGHLRSSTANAVNHNFIFMSLCAQWPCHAGIGLDLFIPAEKHIPHNYVFSILWQQFSDGVIIRCPHTFVHTTYVYSCLS